MTRDRTRRIAFWTLLLVATATRLWFGLEFTGRDLGLERYRLREMRHFTLAAERILAGDLVMRGSIDDYQALIDRMGAEQFYGFSGRVPLAQAPLYPYLLAGARWSSPSSWAPVRWLQILLTLAIGLLTAYLAWLVSGNEAVAALAFAFYAFHPPSLLYAGFLLRETVFTLLLLLFVVVLTRHALRPRLGHAIGLGALLALLHMTRSSLLLCLPLAAVVLATRRERWGARARDGLALAASFAVVVSPLVVRNLVCDTGLLHNDAFGPMSIIIGNNPGSDGIHEVWPSAEYAQAILRESGPSLPAVLLHSLGQFTPGQFARLLLAKAHGFVNGYESWNIIRYQTYYAVMPSLRALPLISAVLMPLALLGALTSLPRWRRTWPLHAGLLVVLVPCLAIYASSRYRVPAVPFLAALAACGLRSLRHAPRPKRVGMLSVLVVFAILAYPSQPNRVKPTLAYAQLGNLYYGTGQHELAKVHLFDAIRTHPLSIAPPLRLKRLPKTTLWREYVGIHRQAYEVCQLTRDAEGIAWLRTSLARHLLSDQGTRSGRPTSKAAWK